MDKCSRSRGGGRCVGRAILNAAQYCLNTTLYHGGLSAHHMVFGPNPLDSYSWQGYDADLDFVQRTSVTSQFTLQWRLRVMAQEAMLKGMASRNSRRILDRNKSFARTDIAIGDSVNVYKETSS